MVINIELSNYESGASERDQIKHPEWIKRIDRKKNRENDDLVDTDIETESNTEVENTTEITESPMNNEGLENMFVQYTENTELITSKPVARTLTETPDENVDTTE